MSNWPNFFIVGASRAGTSSLYEYLKKIPGIYMSPEKEPHYFSKVTPGRFKISDEKTYLELFHGVKNEIAIGEASTTYLRDRETPKQIYKKIPYAKIIIILRDPIEQFVSSYFFNLYQRKSQLSLHGTVLKGKIDENGNLNKLNNGYSAQVKRYLDVFGASQIKIIIFEEFSKEPKKIIQEVVKFLGINEEIKNFDSKVYNPRIVEVMDKLNEKDEEILIKFFQDDVIKLQSILGRKLPWTNFKDILENKWNEHSANIKRKKILALKNTGKKNILYKMVKNNLKKIGFKPTIIELNPKNELSLEKNIVWVFGSIRGGTTWLGSQLLSYNTQIMSEPRFARFVGDRRMWIEVNGKKEEIQGKNPDYIFSHKTKKTWLYFLRKLILNRVYSQYPDLLKKIVMKEPLEKGGSDIISECLPNSKIIILLRDGRDVVDSKLDALRDENSWGVVKEGRKPINPANRLHYIQNYSQNWVELMEDLMRAYNNHAENLRILVRYEDLRNNTVDELKKIYEFLQIEIKNEELEKLVSKYSFENIPAESKGQGKFTRFASPGKWKENFNEKEKNLMDSIMGKTLAQLHYKLEMNYFGNK